MLGTSSRLFVPSLHLNQTEMSTLSSGLENWFHKTVVQNSLLLETKWLSLTQGRAPPLLVITTNPSWGHGITVCRSNTKPTGNRNCSLLLFVTTLHGICQPPTQTFLGLSRVSPHERLLNGAITSLRWLLANYSFSSNSRKAGLRPHVYSTPDVCAKSLKSRWNV